MEPRKVPHIHYDYINGTFREGINNIKFFAVKVVLYHLEAKKLMENYTTLSGMENSIIIFFLHISLW